MDIEVDEVVLTIATREEDTTGIKVAEAAMRAIEGITKAAIEVITKAAIEEDMRAKEGALKAAEEAMTIPIVEVEVAEEDTNHISTTNQELILAITNNHQKGVVIKGTTIVGEEDIKTNLALPPTLTNKVKIEVDIRVTTVAITTLMNKVKIEVATEVTIIVAITTLKEAGDINNLKEVVDNNNGNSAKMESSKRPPKLISNESDTERQEFEDNKLMTFF